MLLDPRKAAHMVCRIIGIDLLLVVIGKLTVHFVVPRCGCIGYQLRICLVKSDTISIKATLYQRRVPCRCIFYHHETDFILSEMM